MKMKSLKSVIGSLLPKHRKTLSCFFLCLASFSLEAIAKEVPHTENVSAVVAPFELAPKLRGAIEKTGPAVVAVKVNRSNASGVIISADGEVLTAAHVAANLKDGKTIITLPDGTKREAKLLGLAHEADIALLKMEAGEASFPFAEVVEEIPRLGKFCFAYSHPGGLKKDRPAQVRLGRVRAMRVSEGVVDLVFSDANIQPGDSGGGLFDLSGKLIGLTSTAGDLNINRYASMEMFHKLSERLRAGEEIGEAPERSKEPGKYTVLEKKTLKLVREEFMKRLDDKHHPTLAIVRAKAGGTGKVKLDQASITKIVGGDASTLQKTGAIAYGMDDPALLAKLPSIPDRAVKRLPVMAGLQRVGYGVPISANELLVKWSLVAEAGELVIRYGKNELAAVVSAKDEKWDLAILKCEGDPSFNAIIWPEKPPEVSAGTLLLARDEYWVTSWGAACDSARPIRKERFAGAMMQPEKISVHCGPYDDVIRHSLPLFAADACAPVFNFDGELVGIHIARNSRSTGLVISMDTLRNVVDAMRRADADMEADPPQPPALSSPS